MTHVLTGLAAFQAATGSALESGAGARLAMASDVVSAGKVSATGLTGLGDAAELVGDAKHSDVLGDLRGLPCAPGRIELTQLLGAVSGLGQYLGAVGVDQRGQSVRSHRSGHYCVSDQPFTCGGVGES